MEQDANVSCAAKSASHDWDSKTVLTQNVYDALSAHSSNGFKAVATLRRWDVCDELHDDEMELDCASLKPYSSLHMSDSKIVHLKVRTHLQGRSVSAYSSTKSHSKAVRPNTSNMVVRRSKSSRCITSAKSSSALFSPQRVIRGGSVAPSSGRLGYRAMSEPAIKQSSKFLLPFNTVQDIPYDFRPFLRHQQHIESYRKSYTYILMRRFRELRINGYAGYKLQAALRLNVSSPMMNKLKAETAKPIKIERTKPEIVKSNREQKKLMEFKAPPPPASVEHRPVVEQKPFVAAKLPRPCRKTLTPPPVLYFSETCHSGPVLYSRCKIEKSAPGKESDIIISAGNSTVLLGYEKVHKSASETTTARPAKDKLFCGENAQKKNRKEVMKSPKPFQACIQQKKSNPQSIGPLIVGRSTKTSKPSPKFIRKMSPLGRVPVSGRRPYASVRDKRSTSVHAIDGSQYLSIATRNQTVISPYSQKRSEIESDVPMT